MRDGSLHFSTFLLDGQHLAIGGIVQRENAEKRPLVSALCRYFRGLIFPERVGCKTWKSLGDFASTRGKWIEPEKESMPATKEKQMRFYANRFSWLPSAFNGAFHVSNMAKENRLNSSQQ